MFQTIKSHILRTLWGVWTEGMDDSKKRMCVETNIEEYVSQRHSAREKEEVGKVLSTHFLPSEQCLVTL